MLTVCAIITGKTIFANKYIRLAVLLLLIPAGAFSASSQELISHQTETSPELKSNECIKCHARIVAEVKENGESHFTKVSCVDCHLGHPPATRNIIPPCSNCHTGHAHFELKNCLQCHTNPHTPLKIYLTKFITDPCTTCHHGQKEQLQENWSIHTTLDCTACHIRHGFLPPCFMCHGPHLDNMSNEECQDCHLPHMPMVVSYPDNTPSEYCGACHKEVFALLGKSRAKHRRLLCATCHVKKHKTIPECTKCHSSPHPSSILERYSKCGECHGLAHDLKLNKIDIRLEKKQPL